jgi:hypothetical protein
MATATYGTRDGTRFSPGGTLNDTQYYTLVDAKTGLITVKSPTVAGYVGGANADRTVGTIPATGANKGKFQFLAGNTTTEENAYFSKPENTKAVKNQAIITANKAQVAEGVTAQTAQNRSQQLINQGTTTTATGTDPENPQANFEDTTAGASALTSFGQTIGDKSVRPEYGDHSYPKPFPEKQDRVKFSMFRYSPKNLDVDNFKTGDVFGKRSQPKNNMGTVQLPITPQIQDTNTVSWGNDDMNSFAAMAASASYNIIKTGGTAIAQEAGAVAKLLQSEGGNASLKSAAAAYLAGEAAGGNKSFLTRVTGALINPNTELLFNAPTLRTFGFSFTMSARDPDEAKEIKKIIRFFKQGMSVKRASTGLFLKTPNIFDIKYILGDTNKDHPWINQIKTCALTSCSVNYTPAGNYATFYDGAMSAYEMTLSFTELDPVFEDDYASDNDATIGY